MSDVTQILERLEGDDPEAVRQLFTVVYGELRKLAALQMQGEQPGQTLQATALVHEACLWQMPPMFSPYRPEPPTDSGLTQKRGC